jgi:hypothetical protein
MSQRDIIEFLKKKRIRGNNRFFSVQEINKGIHSNNSWSAAKKLNKHGYLEKELQFFPKKTTTYRLKNKYIKD